MKVDQAPLLATLARRLESRKRGNDDTKERQLKWHWATPFRKRKHEESAVSPFGRRTRRCPAGLNLVVCQSLQLLIFTHARFHR